VKGKKTWTCDNCGAKGTWGRGWSWFPGVPSQANAAAGELIYPWICCCSACADESCDKWHRCGRWM